VFNPWLGHAALLKLLGRVCHPFESHKAWGISLYSCAQSIPDLRKKKHWNYDFTKSSSSKIMFDKHYPKHTLISAFLFSQFLELRILEITRLSGVTFGHLGRVVVLVCWLPRQMERQSKLELLKFILDSCI
jgi:hypothetical protein